MYVGYVSNYYMLLCYINTSTSTIFVRWDDEQINRYNVSNLRWFLVLFWCMLLRAVDLFPLYFPMETMVDAWIFCRVKFISMRARTTILCDI